MWKDVWVLHDHGQQHFLRQDLTGGKGWNGQEASGVGDTGPFPSCEVVQATVVIYQTGYFAIDVRQIGTVCRPL